jgi:tRNA pseudouridine55 synthase
MSSSKAKRKAQQISGIFNVDKPDGLTSHDVVAAIRRASGERRVGHAGTLDPMATGVLLICIGKGTRMAEYLMGHDKRYRAAIQLGVETDTYDASGEVVAERESDDIRVETIQEIIATHFVGEIQQVPPMYSALKRDGVPLYKLARNGIKVERKARQVWIYDFDILDYEHPMLVVDVHCSKGTYIRSLAHDLGQALDVGAHLARLRRMASGDFGIEDAVELPALLEALERDNWQPYLFPPDRALMDHPAIVLDDDLVERVRHGQLIPAERPEALESGSLGRAYTETGDFIAVLRYKSDQERWHPTKVFVS